MIKEITDIISDGYAMGYIYKESIKDFSTTKDIEAFNKSLAICNKELDELISKDEKLGEFILFQKLMLNDPILKKSVIKFLETSSSVVEAIDKTISEYTTGLMNSPSLYLRERVNDFEDLALGLKRNLEINDVMIPNNKFILITDELYPTSVIKYKDKLLGVIAKKGGYTSHSAILCRQLNIPYVIYPHAIECKKVIIDSYKKNLILDYTNEQEITYKNKVCKNSIINIVEHKGFNFLANVSSNEDIKFAMEQGFDGIGLYRTEFIFYNSDNVLSYEKQETIYKEAVELAGMNPITFRTFDIGDDKNIPFIKSSGKGIKNYLNNSDIFINQIKAISSTSKFGNVKILLPMIRTNEEYNYLKKWILDISDDKNIKIGMMLETKEALENIESFTNVDFISIGTNDLTLELYRKSRDSKYNKKITIGLINKLIPVIKYANNQNISLSLCGEIASIPEIAYMLYKIGIKDLSVNPSSISSLNDAYFKFKNK